MKLKLISLPDNKVVHKVLTIGNEYEIVKEFGVNGYLAATDDPDLNIIILQERYEKAP